MRRLSVCARFVSPSAPARPRHGESVSLAPMPEPAPCDETLLEQVELLKETVTAVRNVRKQRNLPAKEPLELRVIADENYHPELGALLRKTANLTDVETVAEKPANVTLCPTRDDLISLLKVSPVEHSLVLVKGSHGMGLEQALEAL